MPEEIAQNLEKEKVPVITETNSEGEEEINNATFFEEERARERLGESDQSYKSVLAQVQASKNDDQDNVANDAQLIMEKKEADARVQNLVQLAFDKGVVHAVRVARQLDYYSTDKLHDLLLTDELHRALIMKGLLKED